MAHAQGAVLAREETTMDAAAPREPSDQVLLERFVRHSDQAAFADLVGRYGKIVWSVCRRLLPQEADVEDAFQAVLIILARKAASIRKGEAVGSWLYGVAYRTAMRARRTAARRQRHESQAAPAVNAEPEPWANEACRELQRLLDEEMERLADKYRRPFVLCCLEGMSRAEAARELRLKEGTLSGLLARARKLLEKRLARRGVVLSAALAASALAANAPAAAAPPLFVHSATESALGVVSGTAPAGSVSPTAVTLARAVIRAMAASKLKKAVLLLILSLMIGGATLAGLQLVGEQDVLDPDLFVGPGRALGTAVDEQVLTVAFSPDSTRLVTAGGRQVLPGQLQIWDVATSKNPVTIRGIPGVRSVAFAPDGLSLATGDISGHIKLRDGKTGQETAAVKGHDAGVNGVAFSPDGTMLVSAGLDGGVKLWSVPGLQERKVMKRHTDMVLSAAFFHHSPLAVTGGQDKIAIIWNTAMGEQKLVLKGHGAPVESVAVAPDDKIVATASWDHTIKLWDAVTGKELAVLKEEDATPYGLSFSRDGQLLASVRSDGEVRIWNMKTHKPTDQVRKHAAAAWAVAFSPDGKLLATGSSDRTAKVWHIGGGDGPTRSVKTLPATSPLIRPILALAYAPDGRFVAMAAQDTPVQIRAATSGDVIRVLSGHTGDVYAIAFSPDGKILASGGADGVIKLWDPASGAEKKTLRGRAGPVQALAFNPDGTRVASAGQDKVIRVWDIASGRELDSFQGHEGPVRALSFTPDGRTLVSGSEDATIKIWDLTRAKEPVTLKGHAGAVRALVVPGGETLISGSEDSTIVSWDIAAGRMRFRLPGHAGGVRALALTPSGRILVSCGEDKNVRVWDSTTGELRATLGGHKAPVWALAVQPRGKDVLSGGEDTLLLRWQGAKQAPAVVPVERAAKLPQQAPPVPAVAGPGQGGPPDAGIPPVGPPRTHYPHEFRRTLRGTQQPLPPFVVTGPEADLFIHPEEKGMRITLPAQRNGTDPVGIVSTAPIEGDFEITAGYEILQAERPKSGSGVGFELYLMTVGAGQDALAMMRIARAWGTNVLACSHNFTKDGKRRFEGARDTSASNRSGRLRIVRNGTVAIFLAAEGDSGEFRELHRCAFVPDPLRMVRLAAYTGQRREPVDVRLTELRIRAETLPEELVAEIDEDASGWLMAALAVVGVAVVLGGVGFYVCRRRSRSVPRPKQQARPASLPTAFACSGCGKRLKAKPELAGRKVKCPECGTAVQVPAVETALSSTHIKESR